MSRGAVGNRLPEAGAGFIWDDIGRERSVPVLRPIVEGVIAAFTTRVGGVSSAPFDEFNVSFRVGDDDDNARTNRRTAGRAVDGPGEWTVVKQVHGTDVVAAGPPGNPAEADGLWTDDPERVVAVLGADCVPVLLSAPGRLAVAHAGWRGLVGGVVGNAIAAVGTMPAVFAGPAIGPCCFEVGAEVAGAFAARFGERVLPDDRHVDLWAAAEAAAVQAGVTSFAAARICTSCHPELLFSHRRDEGRTGRQALVARRRR